MFKNLFERLFKRNYAISQVDNIKSPEPVYNDWTVYRAVKEGYSSNTWVFRAVNLIVRALSNVPWYVRDDDGIIESHHLTKLFQNPNPSVSKNDIWELFVSWLELAGNSYAIKVKAGGRTQELWPVSPDRMEPLKSPSLTEWMAGYVVDKNKGKSEQTFLPGEVLQFKYFNPANPLLGISPLQAAAKTVDVDNDQLDWSKSTMQNRGVIDGVFTFEREFESIEATDEVAESLNKKYGGKSNARKLAVLGGKATYHRTALTPQEADFSSSRKDNRDEIFIAFGIPPQLGGSQESSTYNNYEVSILIFWFSTLIPKLDDFRSELNFSFADELAPGEKIVYDLSNIKAIRKAMLDQAETAEKLFAMGVPFEKVNRIFDFGVEEFDGWDKSYVKTNNNSGSEENTEDRAINPQDLRSNTIWRLAEKRAADDTEKEIEKQSQKHSKVFKKLLSDWEKKIFAAIDRGEGTDVKALLDSDQDEWEKALNKMYIDTGVDFGMDLIEQQERQAEDELTKAINLYLEEEILVLVEYSNISASTADAITARVAEGLLEGSTSSEIQQALIDSGIFSESRALQLGRTITGTAANLGSITGARLTGATHKTWLTAGGDVRDTHRAVNNKRIPINDFFRVGGEQARYPLDNRLSPGERVNCRCTLTYDIED